MINHLSNFTPGFTYDLVQMGISLSHWNAIMSLQEREYVVTKLHNTSENAVSLIRVPAGSVTRFSPKRWQQGSMLTIQVQKNENRKQFLYREHPPQSMQFSWDRRALPQPLCSLLCTTGHCLLALLFQSPTPDEGTLVHTSYLPCLLAPPHLRLIPFYSELSASFSSWSMAALPWMELYLMKQFFFSSHCFAGPNEQHWHGFPCKAVVLSVGDRRGLIGKPLVHP